MAEYLKPAPRQADGEALRKEGKRWIERIDAAEKLEKTWIEDAEKAVTAYTGEKSSGSDTRYDFNILFANVETIVPAIINSPPQPDIRRRFADDDPVAKDGSELLERSIRIQVDDSRLQTEMESAAQDAFLAGRGLVRLRFKADVEGEVDNDELHDLAEETVEHEGELAASGNGSDRGDERAEPDSAGYGADSGQSVLAEPSVRNERVCFEAVSWRDYRHGPAKRWEDRPWEAFRHSIPMEDLEAFADKAITNAQAVPEDKLERGDTDNDVVIWEIWCRKTKKVKFVEYETGKLLKVVEDPLGLTNFYPICTPIQPIEVTGRLMPVNPFAIYRKLADELDTTTKRINAITDQMRVRGWYPGDATELANMLDAGDVDFVPLANPEIWAQNGGIEGAVAFWPIDKFIQALRELYVAREATKQAIYEITGISDIVRGASKAGETLGAQQIKTQWGSLRIQKMQRMMERAARDLFVMMAEIIPGKFSAETLQKMTGIQLIPTQQDLQPLPPPPQPPIGPDTPPEEQQQMQQMFQQASQQHQQAEQQRQKKLAHLQGLNDLLNDDVARFYRIDVESDSTVRADLTQKKQDQAEFLTGAAAYFQGIVPAVELGVISQEGAIEIFAATARLFTLGKSTEDALEREIATAKEKAAQPKQEKPDPQAIKAEADAKAADADAQRAETEAQMSAVEGAERQQALASKTEEEALQRRIKEQEAIDASAKRNADLTNATALAELQRTQQAEAHAQKMDEGALQLILLNKKIEQAEVQTDNSIATTTAAVNAAAANVETKKQAAAAKPAPGAK